MAEISRRGLLKAAAQLFVGSVASSALGGLYAMAFEPEWLQVERVRLPLKKLRPDLQGFTIAQFSDLHFGPYMRGADAVSIVERINRLQPNLVVFTGDFVTDLAQGEAKFITDVLARLQPTHGTYAILGNHDHWTDAEVVDQAVRAARVTLLRNENRLVEIGSVGFWLAGVDDVWEEKHDLEAALAGVGDDLPVILLAHEPDYADEVNRTGRVDLQLSGHSHGGQVRLPYYGALALPYLAHKYPFGLYKLGSTTLYTNRGVGLLAPPVRFNCRPEITLFELSAPTATGELQHSIL
jgi:predicted MPP superfamily phosphohydrolase